MVQNFPSKRFPLRSYPMQPKPLVAIALVLVAVAAWHSPVVACNTPVFRYAMYNWQTAPYIVFYFYEGEIPESDQAIHKTMSKLTEEWPPQANIRLEPIDVSEPKNLEILPDFVVEAWKSHDSGKTPAYVIFSPMRAHIYTGSLDAESVVKLIDSPARQRLGQLLEQGNAAVMILLTCADEEQNKKAEEALAGLRKMAKDGEIPLELELPPMGLPGGEEQEGADGDAAKSNNLGIAVLKVDRTDPAEEFFVRMLMTIEDDLKDYADQPMIFAGYGRGRALEPYIGKGISAENLVDVVAFLAGACSCMVKDQNPGADMLVKWNWEATADKMAQNDASLDYGQSSYSEYPAEAVAEETAETEESMDDAASPAATEVAQSAPVDEATAPADAAPSGDATAADAEPEVVAAPAAAEADAPENAQAHAAPAESPPASFSRQRMMTYAIGFGAIALGVLVAGFALVLRRS